MVDDGGVNQTVTASSTPPASASTTSASTAAEPTTGADAPAASTAPTSAPQSEQSAQDELISGFLAVTRALVALSARSLIHFDADVSFVQYRVLIVLVSRGPLRTTDLAAEF